VCSDAKYLRRLVYNITRGTCAITRSIYGDWFTILHADTRNVCSNAKYYTRNRYIWVTRNVGGEVFTILHAGLAFGWREYSPHKRDARSRTAGRLSPCRFVRVGAHAEQWRHSGWRCVLVGYGSLRALRSVVVDRRNYRNAGWDARLLKADCESGMRATESRERPSSVRGLKAENARAYRLSGGRAENIRALYED